MTKADILTSLSFSHLSAAALTWSADSGTSRRGTSKRDGVRQDRELRDTLPPRAFECSAPVKATGIIQRRVFPFASPSSFPVSLPMLPRRHDLLVVRHIMEE
jgi:hypothetical protein